MDERAQAGTRGARGVRTSAEGGTSTRRAYERAPGHERARGGTNTAGATRPSSPSTPPPLPPFFLFLYYSNIIYIFLYTCNTVFQNILIILMKSNCDK